jgi:hypothetical protein
MPGETKEEHGKPQSGQFLSRQPRFGPGISECKSEALPHYLHSFLQRYVSLLDKASNSPCS